MHLLSSLFLAASVAAVTEESITILLEEGEGPLKYLYNTDVNESSKAQVATDAFFQLDLGN